MDRNRKLTGYVLVDPFDGAIVCMYPVGKGFEDYDCVYQKLDAIKDAEKLKTRGVPYNVYGCINNEYSDSTKIYPKD